MWENGSYKPKNLEAGMLVVGENPTTQSCFAMEILELARLLLGNKERGSRKGRKRQVLTSHGASSLVIDRFCDQVERRNAAVAYFYLDFAARND